MKLEKFHAAYEKAVLVMLEAAPGMPRDLDERAVQSIAELVLALINVEVEKELDDATDNQ